MNTPGQGSSDGSSKPTVHTSSFHQQSFQDAAETVSADQERQVLLLMLLAQVCALHDPTPKTFTIHVVELFERGILDRESIHFLFELGLVPAMSPPRRISSTFENGPDAPPTELALARADSNSDFFVFASGSDRERAEEAYAIRRKLAQFEQQVQQEEGSTPTPGIGQPWEAKHFPLSLSRYQREFVQQSLLAAGSFGQVFHATRKMDGCDYAIKKVDFDATGYSNEPIQEVVREVECLARVSDHPNIVRYYTSWLEPSWMTGGPAVDSAPAAAQQRKQLTNQLQHLLKNESIDSSDESSSGFWNKPGAFDNSNSTYDPSSTFNRPRRRFSLESSMDDRSYGNYYDQSWDGLERVSFDDSYIASYQHHRRRESKTQPATSSYRYQISLYIQMQLCHPASLADWIRERNSKVPEADCERRIGPALEIFSQIAKGLAHVHSKGIIHRDLKPANIFASNDGQVIKIGDFGLSRELRHILKGTNTTTTDSAAKAPSTTCDDSASSHHEHWQSATQEIVLKRSNLAAIVEYRKTTTTAYHKVGPLTAGIGTRSYAAPEQMQTQSYSTAADVFSVGLILLELVSCFETEHERLHNFQECRNQRLPQWLVDRYPVVADIILGCTRRNPPERPSATDVLARLAGLRSPSNASPPEDVHTLRKSLEKKDEELEKHKLELEEKDRTIEALRLEMERMKSRASKDPNVS